MEDLRPVLEMRHLYRDASSPTPVQSPALQFSGCKAPQQDPKLKELSEIEDDQTRFIETVRYLSTLPAYPALLPHQEISLLAEMKEDISEYREFARDIRNAVMNTSSEWSKEKKHARNILAKQLKSARNSVSKCNKLLEGTVQKQAQIYEELEAFKEEFTERVAVSEPVRLWAEKQAEHKTQQQRSFWWFIAGLGLTAAIAISILAGLVLMPQDLQVLLSPPGCDVETGNGCSGLGLRGTLMIAAFLFLFTVSLWFARLQMKLYLAERHMRLDAREREAFTKAYIGLLSAGDTSEEAAQQRALVYGALFRPGSDGTVKEEGGLDPAISAAVSRLSSK